MAHYRRRNGKWQVIVTKPDGKQLSRTDPLKRVLEVWARQTEADLASGKWNDYRPARTHTVAGWREQWDAGRVVEPATRKKDDSHWRTRVEPHWGQVRLSDVKRPAVQAWLAQMVSDGVGVHSIHGAVNHLGAILQAAVVAEPPLLTVNPARGLTLPRAGKGRLRFFSRQEWLAIDARLPEPHRTLVELACFSGLRWGELTGLAHENVDLERREIHVRRVLTRDGLRDYGKSEASHRTVPLTPSLGVALQPFVEAAATNQQRLVFVAAGGKEMDESNFRSRIWRPALAAAGVEHAPFHTCRHTAASWLVQAGVDLYRVQALLGHESQRTTERYSHLAPDAHDTLLRAWSNMAAVKQQARTALVDGLH